MIFLSLWWSDFSFKKTRLDHNMICKTLLSQPGPSKLTQRHTVVTRCLRATKFFKGDNNIPTKTFHEFNCGPLSLYGLFLHGFWKGKTANGWNDVEKKFCSPKWTDKFTQSDAKIRLAKIEYLNSDKENTKNISFGYIIY